MKKYEFINTFIVLFLLLLFLWQTISATLKYLKGTTITSTINIDDGSILFPSVTVCKKYWFGSDESDFKDYSNVSQLISKARIHRNTWNKSEMFYFVSHPKMFNISFPCTTMEGTGTTPGKPCSFPFTWGGENEDLKEGCTLLGNCATRWNICSNVTKTALNYLLRI